MEFKNEVSLMSPTSLLMQKLLYVLFFKKSQNIVFLLFSLYLALNLFSRVSRSLWVETCPIYRLKEIPTWIRNLPQIGKPHFTSFFFDPQTRRSIGHTRIRLSGRPCSISYFFCFSSTQSIAYIFFVWGPFHSSFVALDNRLPCLSNDINFAHRFFSTFLLVSL